MNAPDALVEKTLGEIHYTESSGNVFVDLGLPEPELLLAKSQAASEIMQIVREQTLTEEDAGRLMGIGQPEVSAILSGHLSGFSLERLLRCLNGLGKDVRIMVSDKASEDAAFLFIAA